VDCDDGSGVDAGQVSLKDEVVDARCCVVSITVIAGIAAALRGDRHWSSPIPINTLVGDRLKDIDQGPYHDR